MNQHLPFDDGFEPFHASSPTDRVILELQMYGHRPHQDEPDPRPLPDETAISAGLAGVFETLAGMLEDTRLEPDLEDLLWSTVNLFHRAAEPRHTRPRSQRGGAAFQPARAGRLRGEVGRAGTAHGTRASRCVERRNAFEVMRDEAADLFEAQTGSHGGRAPARRSTIRR